MKRIVWSLAALVLVVLAGAGGALWLLYQETDLPVDLVLEEFPAVEPRHELEVEEITTDDAAELVEAEPVEAIDWPEGVVPGELILSFANSADLEAFLREARQAGLTDLEMIPALNLVRVRTRSDEEFRRASELAGNAGVALNPFIATPEVPPLEGMGDRYLPFGDQALAWMGVPDDNAGWGEGVRIAILDTGVGAHPSLAGASITHMSMLGDGVDVGTHGTAVASLLVGQGDVRGIAPGADLLSIQVLDGSGTGNAFDLARGILAAVDGGANIINLSLGTPTDAAFLREAVLYAQQRGAVIIAASGNDGAGRSLYPAGYNGVISVGSVDGHGQHVWFSNRDANLSLVAPGYGLAVAGPDGGVTWMNGTSFAAPLVSGAAAFVSQTVPTLGVAEALIQYANDGGPPGHDGYYGNGTPDMERVTRRNQPNVYDLAVTGYYLDRSRGIPELVIGVQNQGNETVGGVLLEVDVSGHYQRFSIGTLTRDAVGEARLPLTNFLGRVEFVDIFSVVSAPGISDARPWNDARRARLFLGNP